MTKLFGLIVSLCVSVVSNADVVYYNPWTEHRGMNSGAYDFASGYSPSDSAGQEFSLENNYHLSSVEFWGTAQNYTGTPLANLEGFQVVVWDLGFNNRIVDLTIDLNDITTEYIEEGWGGEFYKFTFAFDGIIQAGTYVMNIGGIYTNPAAEQFIWARGTDTNGWWMTSANGPVSYGNWWQPTMIGSEQAGAFALYTPSPGVIGLLALAGLTANRRRK